VAEVLVRRTVRGVASGYVAALVIVPVSMVAWRSAQQGAGAFWQAISSAQAVAAFRLTAVVAGSAVAGSVVGAAVVTGSGPW
jgi:sulfate transport system permease protein